MAILRALLILSLYGMVWLSSAEASGMTVTTRYPTTNEIVTTGWTNPNNAHADDDVFATADPAQNATVSSRYYNFGFDSVIPAGDTILSVTISYQFKVSTTASIASTKARVQIDGVDKTLRTGVPAEPTTLAIVNTAVFGDVAWTPADLDDASFKVEIQAVRGNSATAVTFSLDYVTVSVQHVALAPSAMADGHMLISWSNEDGSFFHLDATGEVIDQIFPPGVSVGWQVNNFAQFQNATYLILTNHNVSPTVVSIMEFDKNLAYVRTIFGGIDWTDPAQNPGYPGTPTYGEFDVEAYFIVLDPDGNIYLDNGQTSENIWKYDNNGAFLALFDVGTHVVSPQGNMSMKPDEPCELAAFFQGPNPADLDGVLRWNHCTNALIGTISTGAGTRPNGQFNANCLDARLYLEYGSPTAAPYVLKVYDTNYSVLNTIASLTMPSGSSIFIEFLPVTGDATMWVIARSLATAPATGPNTFYLQQVNLSDNSLVGSPVVLKYLVNNGLSAAMIWHTAPAGCGGGIYPSLYPGIARWDAGMLSWFQRTGA